MRMRALATNVAGSASRAKRIRQQVVRGVEVVAVGGAAAASTSERAANSSSPPRRAWNATANGSDRRRAVIARATSRCTSARRAACHGGFDRGSDELVTEAKAVLGLDEQAGCRGAFEVVEDTNGAARAARMPGDRRRPPDRSRSAVRIVAPASASAVSSRSTASRIDERDIVVGSAEIIAWSSSGCPPLRSCRTPARSSPARLTRRRQIEWAERQHDLVGDAGAVRGVAVTTIIKRRAHGGSPTPTQASVDDSARWWRSSMTSTVETRAGEHVEGPQHRPEQLTLAAVGARRHRRRGCRMSDPDRRGQRRRLVGRQPVERTGLGHAHGRRDGVGDGCQWKISAELVAAALGDEHLAAIEVAQPHADEGRLPDPGLPLDGDDGRPPSVRIVEEPVEPRQLRAAAGRGRVRGGGTVTATGDSLSSRSWVWSRSVSALGDTPSSSANRALALAYAASAAAVLPDDACARMSIRSTSSSNGCSTSTASA